MHTEYAETSHVQHTSPNTAGVEHVLQKANSTDKHAKNNGHAQALKHTLLVRVQVSELH